MMPRLAKSASEALDLFLLQSKIVLMRMLAYRVDFVLSLVVALGFSSLAPLFQFLLYRSSNGYPGWSWDQILVFQSVLLLTQGLSETLFGAIRGQVESMMANGEFDRLMIKPRRPLLLILTGGFQPSGLGSVIAGIILVVISSARAGLPPGAMGVLVFLALLGVRLVFQVAVQVLYCFFTLRWVYPMRLSEIMDKVQAWGNYPLEIFPRALGVVFSTVVPFSIACHWPARALLEPVGLMALGAVAGTGAFLALSLVLWRHQLRKYSSGGG